MTAATSGDGRADPLGGRARMPSPRTKPSITSIVAFGMLLTVLYVLSYAPVVSVWDGPNPTYVGLDPALPKNEYPPYKAVDWLIDETPLREPLFCWADIWGVREEFEWAGWLRLIDRPYDEKLSLELLNTTRPDPPSIED